MTLQQSRRLQSLLLGTLAWAIAILIFFPIFWMVLTSFKTEIDAFATQPQFIFTPTLENYLHINYLGQEVPPNAEENLPPELTNS